MDTSYLATSYSYDDKEYFEPSVAVLPTPCGFQQPQHGHLYPIVPTSIHPVQGSTHLARNDQYDHPIALQPSMFYYAATAAAGPSLSTSQDDATSTLQNKTAIDEVNDASSHGARKRGTKRGRPTKNPVWTFFRRIDDKSVQCNMCARLVKSACATNMSKHLERHHQNTATVTTPSPVNQVDFSEHKYDQSIVGSYDVHPPSWNPYTQHMQPLKHVLLFLFSSLLNGWSPAMITIRVCRRYSAPSQEYRGIRIVEEQNEIVEQNTRCLGKWCVASARCDEYVGRVRAPTCNYFRYCKRVRGQCARAWLLRRVWELFRRTTDGNAQCVLCSVVVRSPCSSNFMGHLNRHHSEHYQDIYNRWLEGRVDMPSLPS